jgi:hypothetical protein
LFLQAFEECIIHVSCTRGDRGEEAHVPESEVFEKGLALRREVLGAEYVDASMADADEFMMPFQRLLTEWA